MAISSSIIQEYYKVVDYWTEATDRKKWKLAIWSAEFADVELIEKFLEIERSPLGQFDDIFFRFDTAYNGNDDEYIDSLWEEYNSWFTESLDEKHDILKALKQDNMLKCDYIPNMARKHTAVGLWDEMLKFKDCVNGLKNTYFCIYFPPERLDGPMKTGWFNYLIQEGVPDGIRLVTIDYKQSKKIDLSESDKIIVIQPKLNVQAALRNEMSKKDSGSDLLAPEGQFKRQVTIVSDCILKKDKKLMDKEVKTLLAIAKELNETSVHFSSLFIAAQAYYGIKEYKVSMEYSDKTIKETEKAMEDNIPVGYSYWKMALFMKAAILSTEKDRKEAILLYETVAEKATKQKDPFYVMEGYRMSGYLLYEQGKLEMAFEHFLLSISGGSYLSLDIRRSAAFLYSAHLALHIGKKIRSPQEVEVIEDQLKIWLGDDWKELVESQDMNQATVKRKSSIFS